MEQYLTYVGDVSKTKSLVFLKKIKVSLYFWCFIMAQFLYFIDIFIDKYLSKICKEYSSLLVFPK